MASRSGTPHGRQAAPCRHSCLFPSRPASTTSDSCTFQPLVQFTVIVDGKQSENQTLWISWGVESHLRISTSTLCVVLGSGRCRPSRTGWRRPTATPIVSRSVSQSHPRVPPHSLALSEFTCLSHLLPIHLTYDKAIKGTRDPS